MRKTIQFALLALLPFLAMQAQPSCAPAAVRCVGSGQEYTTIQTAIDASVAGDLIYVFNGSYAGGKFVSPHVSGTSSQPITMQAQSLSVIINTAGDSSGDGIDIDTVNWIVVDGFSVTSQTRFGVRVVLADNVTVKNCHVHGNASDGILAGFAQFLKLSSNEVDHNGTLGGEHNVYVANANTNWVGTIIRGNTIHDSNSGNNIQVNGDCNTTDPSGYSTGKFTGALIEGNRLYNSAAHGIQMIDMQYSIVRNNVDYADANDAFVTTTESGCNFGTSFNQIVNNTIDIGSHAGIRITQPAASNVIWNNVIVGTSWTCVDSEIPATCSGVFTNNNFFAIGWNGTPSSAASGVFTNYAGHDYTLAMGSPAIGAGVASAQSYTSPAIDLLGNGRPVSSTWDAGAYEFGGSAAGPGTPSTPSGGSHNETPYRVNLLWTASTDTLGIRAYYIYRDAVLYDAATLNSYSDTGVTAGTSHTYSVTSFDFAETESSALSFGSISVPGIVGCVNTDTTWRKKIIPTQAGSFTLEADVTPFGSGSNAVFGVSPGIPSTFGDMATLVLFGGSGIQARNGSVYTSDNTVTWSAGLTYHVRQVVNVTTDTYSVFVTPPSSGEITLAANYAFRSEQHAATLVQYMGAESDVNSIAVCSPSLNGVTLSSMAILPVISSDSVTTYLATNGTGNPVFDHPKPVQLTTNYTLTALDAGKLFYSTSSSTLTITVPSSGLGDSFGAVFLQQGSGTIAFSGGTLHSVSGASHTIGPWSAASVQCTVSNACILWGGVQ